MKNKRSLPALASLAITLSILAAGQAMAQTWTGNTNNLWDTDTNWSGTPPASSGSSAMIFNPADLTGASLLATSNDLISFTATDITFDNSTTSGAYTLAGNQMTLGGNITTTGSTGTSTHTISLATILNGNRTITTALNNNLSISGIISQDIAGRGLTKVGVGLLTLSGNNSYSGGTNIDAGTVQINTGGTLGATTSALNMGTGSIGTLGTVGNLTLNTSATIGAMSVRSNTADVTAPANIGQLAIASGSTLTATSFTAGVAGAGVDNTSTKTALGTGSTAGAGGILTVNGNTTIGLNGPSAGGFAHTVVDLSGLHTFNATSTSGFLSVGSAPNSRGSLTLANNANTINAGTISIGDAGGANNYSAAQFSEMKLGAGTNNLWSPNLHVGRNKGTGQITFAGANGSINIAGLNGTGTSAISIGVQTQGGGSNSQENQLLLAGHTANVAAGVVNMAHHAGGGYGAKNAKLTFDTGSFAATSIVMAVGSSINTNKATLSASIVVGGDTANSAATGVMNISGNVLLSDTDDNDGTTNGTLTINGGTVNVNTGAVATQGIRDNSSSTHSSGTNTTLTLQGGTLNLNGGVIVGDGTAGNRTIDTLNFRSGTLMNVLQINNGTTGLTKTTDSTSSGGTLILAGTNSYTGATAVSAGTLLINGSTASGSAVNVAAGATLGGNGTVGGATTFTGTSSHAPGSAATTVGTQAFSSTVSYGTGTIFDWDLNTVDGGNVTDPGEVSDALTGTYDRVTATGAITGSAAVFKIVLATGDSFADAFWNSNKSWTNIFTGGTGTATNLAALFTGGFQASGGLDSSGFVTGEGQFTLSSSSNSLTWTAVPEPTSALVGLLVTAGLLRRRREGQF